jgi:hypothetical protein
MTKSIRKAAAFALISAVSAFVFALDWPSREGVLISNFGENDRGMLALGNAFRSSSPVYPSDAGELVFYRDASGGASRFPSPLGSWIALDHGDNIIGLYSCFEDRNGAVPTVLFEKESVLAESGQSGWTEETGFSFAFFDRKERRWVNPSIVIPPLPDTRPPVIRQVELRGISGLSANPAQIRNIPQGTYTVYVDAFDMISESEEPLAPNRITCMLNGAATDELKFEFVKAKKGTRMISRGGMVPVGRVCRSWPGYEAGVIRLSRGQAALTVEVRDVAENSRSLTYRFMVD